MNDETSLDQLLDQVQDRETFFQFVQALAEEREQAQKLESENPQAYRFNGALGWENGDIASFLLAALACFQDGRLYLDQAPSWRMFAEFLYCGKIYE